MPQRPARNARKANAPKGSQKCGKMSFLFTNTAEPPAAFGPRCEFPLVDDPDPPPHALVAKAAELLARHQIIASLAEPHDLLRDVTGHQHGVDIGALDIDPM